MKTIPSFAVFVILVSATPVSSLDISTGLSSRGSFLVSRMEGFSLKSQRDNALELATLMEFSRLSLSALLGWHGIEPSNLAGGWGYRGLEGTHGRIQMEFPLQIHEERQREPGFVQAGWGIGAGGFFSRYKETDQVIFYPSALISLYLDVYVLSPYVRIRYTLPAEWYFRKDLEASFSMGIGIGILYTWTRRTGL